MLSDLKNRIDFALRNRIRWSRPGYSEPNEDKSALFTAHPELTELEQPLLERYPLIKAHRETSSLLRYRENLNLLQALDTMTHEEPLCLPPLTSPIPCLEIGPKNWATLDALMAFFTRSLDSNFLLTGIELDPWRIYANGFSRWDVAQAHAARFPQAQYLAGDVLDLTGNYQVIVCVLPFLFPEPHQAWGLPKQTFNPERFFDHVVHTLLSPGGVLLLINQGQAEFEAQYQLLQNTGLKCLFSGTIRQDFYPLVYPRFGFVCQKTF